jgi:hypothetical protein
MDFTGFGVNRDNSDYLIKLFSYAYFAAGNISVGFTPIW